MTAAPRIALIGAGSMGANHARVIGDSTSADLAVVIDADLQRARALSARFGGTPGGDLEAALGCDAAIVAASTEHHVAIVRDLLTRDMPILVEKPMALRASDVEVLCSTAEQRGLPIMCGFVERFNAVVSAVINSLDGEPRHAIAIRHSPYAPQVTTSVAWDLLIHDIDIALRLAKSTGVVSVVGQTAELPPLNLTEIADCSIRMDTGMLATLSASRAGQRKMRTWQIATERALYEMDLLRQDVTVFRHISADTTFGMGSRYRSETSIEIPFVRHSGEPLALQFQHFLGLINGSIDADAERRAILPPHVIAQTVSQS